MIPTRKTVAETSCQNGNWELPVQKYERKRQKQTNNRQQPALSSASYEDSVVCVTVQKAVRDDVDRWGVEDTIHPAFKKAYSPVLYINPQGQ